MEAIQQEQKLPGGVPVPTQAGMVPSMPKSAPARPEGPVNLLQPSTMIGGKAWNLFLKEESDRGLTGIMLLNWEDGRVIAKIPEPIIFDLVKKIHEGEATLSDLKNRLAVNEPKLLEAEKLRKYSDIERIAGRIRELTTQIENGKKALEHFRTVAGPAALLASIEAKQKFFDVLKTELDRIDSEIAGGLELHGKMTAKKPAAKVEPAKSAAAK
ncbi:MAG TPA: hypothetical protein PK200_03150 [Spirochaetota bacterium]|nr:hypothetical protein [Spirochaetota bacterium]